MPHVLVTHHTPDLYGSDLQLLESVTALVEAGWSVTVTLPTEGPLTPLLRERGAAIELLAMPVLRKSLLRPRGLVQLLAASLRSVVPAVRLIRRQRPDAVYVNTIIVPLWLVAARLARVPTLCHVHEAHTEGPRLLRAALCAPLILATRVVVNSEASRSALQAALPAAARRSVVVYNGIAGPPEEPSPLSHHDPGDLVVVGRLSPRKGIDVALEALARLRARGYDVGLSIAGTVFPGYEWYRDQLQTRAAADDLAGAVRMLGYVAPTWPLLAQARVVLVPSRTEPFGNTAVEALLAGRPVVASDVGGLPEIVTPDVTGLLVRPDDAEALADAVERVLRDDGLANRLAAAGRAEAQERFSVRKYGTDVIEALRNISGQ